MGMSLFFTLSGFLITTNLLRHPSVPAFLIRRFCRILPLAYLATIVYLAIQGSSLGHYVHHFLFLTNYRHQYTTPMTSVFWSLCVEVHFYVLAALLVAALGKRGIQLLPLLAIGVTALRVREHAYLSIVTHLRADEILAGVTASLIYHDRLGNLGRRLRAAVAAAPWPALALLFFATSHPASGPMQYLRPYAGASLVAHTLFTRTTLRPLLRLPALRYIAEISYALYLIHPLMVHGWFNSGGPLVRYAFKRPISIAATFMLAHLSTFYYERPWIKLGKQASRRWAHQDPPKLARPQPALPLL
jgi:peptidoglycan/LPS O-acetylase OafA/YrhL